MESSCLILLVAVAVALMFEFANGFHDTANAVATVIYTRSMKPHWAVIYSGLLNFLGVMLAGVGVAYSVVNLFPVDQILVDGGLTRQGLALIFSVLGAAIFWNLATWYVGLPASSSHALIGSIVGASMGFCLHQGLPLETGVPWASVRPVMLALFLSPLVGFWLAALTLGLARYLHRNPEIFQEPGPEGSPPGWIRALLVATCGGVSLAHGSNDGQKGMGLIMLILIGLAPASYCLNPDVSAHENLRTAQLCHQAAQVLPASSAVLAASLEESARAWSREPLIERIALRRTSDRQLTALRQSLRDDSYTPDQRQALESCAGALDHQLHYVSTWVKVAVALALGLGTMVGWKRIVVTVGEKIGKSKLTYAQGASAQLVAALTILMADVLKMPVSTTHVLSSGVAGSMYAQRSGLQGRTLRHIALAWVLTLPVCITLAFGLYTALSGT